MKKTKIKIPNSKFFVEVCLYETVKEVQRASRDKTCAAMYRPNGVVIYPKHRVYPKLGTIYLARERLGCGLISHEVLHCSFDYMHKKYNIGSVRTGNSERQEDMCYQHGYLLKEIINWLSDNKL